MSNTEEVGQIMDPDPVRGGHPPGLYMLFFAEMWERFCFYGMRTLLVLYMTKTFLYSDGQAYGVYGSYNSLVYLTPILGGIVADKLLGYRMTIILGGLLMAIGEFALVVETEFALYAGMAVIVVGNGLFKPNISTLVGRLYKEGDPRRDSGFTIFYMGINLGALASTLFCGWIGETYGWTQGFAFAGLGMLLGLVVFVLGKRRLEGHGEPPNPEAFMGNMQKVIAGSLGLAVVVFFMLKEAAFVRYLLFGVIIVVLLFLLIKAIVSEKVQREKLFVLLVLWFFHALFWAFFEQAGSSLTLFTERNVDRMVTETWQFPVTWGQSFNPAFILIFGTVFSLLWVKLALIGKNPSIPLKFALALMQLGAGFGVLVFAASIVDDKAMISLGFLVLCYLLHTTGELCLSPVGLSAVTKLAPKSMTGMVMGAWFLSIAGAHSLAAIIASLTGGAGHGGEEAAEGVVPPAADTLHIYTDVYETICYTSIGAGVFLVLLTPLLKRWLHGVK